MSTEQQAVGPPSTRTHRSDSSNPEATSAGGEDASAGEQTDSGGDDREALVDVFGDEYTRDVLAALSERPLSAAALVDRLEMSRATVYRRLDRLEEHGLVSAETAVSEDGNDYEVFRAELQRLTVDLSDGVPTMTVELGDVEERQPRTALAAD